MKLMQLLQFLHECLYITDFSSKGDELEEADQI